jgi:hypothetical protein
MRMSESTSNARDASTQSNQRPLSGTIVSVIKILKAMVIPSLPLQHEYHLRSSGLPFSRRLHLRC